MVGGDHSVLVEAGVYRRSGVHRHGPFHATPVIVFIISNIVT